MLRHNVVIKTVLEFVGDGGHFLQNGGTLADGRIVFTLLVDTITHPVACFTCGTEYTTRYNNHLVPCLCYYGLLVGTTTAHNYGSVFGSDSTTASI